jgi:magnesium-transporting ATPase (P-type)
LRTASQQGDSIMHRQYSHQSSALARLFKLILQTIVSIITTGIFYTLIFLWFANSGVPLSHLSFPNNDDYKIILFILIVAWFYNTIPSLLAAIFSCYIIHKQPRYLISIGAASVALLCAILQNLFLSTWSPDWLVILPNVLAVALITLYFTRPKSQLPEY